MAIYLDTAKLEEARQARDLGWVFGVTANPLLLAKADAGPEVTLEGLAGLEFHQVYYQLISQDLDDMLAEAQRAIEIVKRGMILKISPTENGFRFVARQGNSFPCCVTAIFDPAQALVAREAGARSIAVYVNRATKQLGDRLALVWELARVLTGSRTEILAASLKSTKEAMAAHLAGAQHIPVPMDLLTLLSKHPLSLHTVGQFNAKGVGIQ